MYLKHNGNFFLALLEWIDGNLEKKISIDEIARKAGYSKWYLQRSFTEYYGVSLGGYIRKRRLDEAAIKLRNSDMSTLDIALLYKWDSQQTFTRSFKNQFGIPPVQWKKSHQLKK